MHSTRRLVIRLSISFVLLGSIIASAAPFASAQAASAQPAPAQTPEPGSPGAVIDETRLKPRTTPVHCSGVESVELDGVRLEVDRVAIQALGECRVRLTNSRIVGRVAVMAAGKASLTFENCLIEGTLQLAGESVTSVKSSTVRGRVRKLQTAQMKDLGKNVWR